MDAPCNQIWGRSLDVGQGPSEQARRTSRATEQLPAPIDSEDARHGVLRSCRRCRSGPQRASRGERLSGTRDPEPAGHARDFSLAAISCLSSRPTELRPPISALSAARRYCPHTTGRLLSFNSVARLAQQFHLEGPHHRWVGHDLDLGDSVTDDAEGEHRTEAPAGSPNRSGSTVDERHLCVCGPPR